MRFARRVRDARVDGHSAAGAVAVKRYKVVTTEGWPINSTGTGRGAERSGLTASVLDTAIIHRGVARFRSEDRIDNRGHTRGHAGAIAAAQAFADEANAECARA